MRKVGDSLKKKIGPLPAWAWLLILGAALYFYRKHQQGSSSTDKTGAGLTSGFYGPYGQDAYPGTGTGGGSGGGDNGGSTQPPPTININPPPPGDKHRGQDHKPPPGHKKKRQPKPKKGHTPKRFGRTTTHIGKHHLVGGNIPDRPRNNGGRSTAGHRPTPVRRPPPPTRLGSTGRHRPPRGR